jgi:hypothetical protein
VLGRITRASACALLLTLLTTACGGGDDRATAPERALDVVRHSPLIQRLTKGSSMHLRVFSKSADSTAIAVDVTPPIAIDATIPVEDSGRSSSYRLRARDVQTLGVTVMAEDDRIVYIAPEWTANFRLVEARWIGPDLGFPPAGGG